jgi:hypothetical protein
MSLMDNSDEFVAAFDASVKAVADTSAEAGDETILAAIALADELQKAGLIQSATSAVALLHAAIKTLIADGFAQFEAVKGFDKTPPEFKALVRRTLLGKSVENLFMLTKQRAAGRL